MYITTVMLDCKIIYILLIIGNTMGNPHLKTLKTLIKFCVK